MQPAHGSPSLGNPNSSHSTSDESEDDSQIEEDNILNLHFSTVPVVTTGKFICKPHLFSMQLMFNLRYLSQKGALVLLSS
jgi:hypothetical protein